MESNFYWRDGKRRQPLPIDPKLQEIVDTVARNQVTIVDADTGSGKTLRIGQALVLADPDVRVWLTQTRRAAVRWNGKRIAWEMGEKPGGTVGWKLHGEKPVVSRQTRLSLLIDQSLANTVKRLNGKLPEGILIIDEAHERSIPTDLLLGLIKEALPQSPKTRIVITSATLDVEKFSAFFEPASLVRVSGRCYPVATKLVELEKFEHISSGAARGACEMLKRFSQNQLGIPTPDDKDTQYVSQGTVIVLLPGKEDITNVMSTIRREAEMLKVSDRVQVLSCHGESDPEEQDRVQSRISQGVLRFVCGTEVLRSSVTLPEVVGVVDSLEVKRFISDARGVGHLTKVKVSKAESDQGKGRAGRTQPGFYMPVAYKADFAGLNPHPTPAILQQPISNVVLQVASIARSARTFPFIDRPPQEKIEVEGVIAARILSWFKKTSWGWEKRGTPVDYRNVDFSEVPEWMVRQGNMWKIVLRAKSEKDSYSRGGKEFPETLRWISDRIRIHFAAGSHSDFAAIVRCYRAFKAEEQRLKRGDLESQDELEDILAVLVEDGESREKSHRQKSRETQLRDWCMRWFVNYKRLRMAEQVMREIRDELYNTPLSLVGRLGEEREFKPEDLTKALAAGLIDNVASGRSGQFSAPIGSFQLANQSACPQGSDLILVGGLRKIPGGRRGQDLINLADLAAPVQAEWLAEIMPQLCSFKLLRDYRYDPQKDAVVETQEAYFVDLKVGSTQVEATDKQSAAETFCAWLAQEMSNERRY